MPDDVAIQAAEFGIPEPCGFTEAMMHKGSLRQITMRRKEHGNLANTRIILS